MIFAMDNAEILSPHGTIPLDGKKEEEKAEGMVDYPLKQAEEQRDKEIDCEMLIDLCDPDFSADFIHDCNWAHDVSMFKCDCLVGKFSCMKPSVQDLCNWSKKHWGPFVRSIWTFEPLANGFFRIDFLSQLDCKFIMENGPWFMGSAGLSLKCWSDDFDPNNAGPIRTPIWVRILYFPYDYWFQCNLIKVSAVIGKVLKISEVVKTKRSLIARVCVEVDCSKKMPSSVSMYHGGVEYSGVLHYEGMPFGCKLCHSADNHGGCSKDKMMRIEKYTKNAKAAKELLRRKQKNEKLVKGGGINGI